jgi:TolA-binding protein
MKKVLITLGLCSALLGLSACPLTTREDIQHDEDDQKVMREQVSTIQRTRADSDQRITEVQNDMSVIAGRVDSVEHNEQVNAQNNRAEIENIKKTQATQNERMKLIEQHIDTTEQRLMTALQAINVGSQSAPANNASSSSDSPLRDADEFLSNKEYKRAIVHYQSYLNKKPHGSKAADATFKIGYCFAELGMKKDAKEFYAETIESFPGTPQAKKAKANLSKLR